ATADKFISTITLADGTGGLASNYKLPATLDSSTAKVTIVPKTLTSAAAIGGMLTKTYDGTTAAPGATVAGSVSGAIEGDTLSLNTSGISLAYNNAHVGNPKAISASGSSTLSINSPTYNSVASDYSFTAPTIESNKSGAIIPVVTIVMPTIQPTVAASAPASSASSGASPSGGDTGAQGGGASSSGTGGSSNTSSDAADSAAQ
ncbi:MAG: YDG domain-containing protein, partial [Burkholderiaceae bacterium]